MRLKSVITARQSGDGELGRLSRVEVSGREQIEISGPPVRIDPAGERAALQRQCPGEDFRAGRIHPPLALEFELELFRELPREIMQPGRAHGAIIAGERCGMAYSSFGHGVSRLALDMP